MFRCIVMDPPWMERGGGKIKRGADRHYNLLKTKEMPRVIYNSGVFNPHPVGCHLWMWSTNNFLPDALWLIDTLGFKYVTNAVWVKDRPGLGQYLRGQHELLLFAVKGKGTLVRTDDKSIPSVFHASRTQHSRKPDSVYEMIERRSKGPYLDMFSRRMRDRWTCWGDELKP